MYAVSDKFNAAVVDDHIPYVRIEVYQPGTLSPIFTYNPITDTGLPGNTMKIADGEVTMDKQSAIRTRLSNLKIVDLPGDLVPSGAGDVFAPFGNEIIVYRGILYADGTSEDVPLGRFRMTTVQVEDKGGGFDITISGYDRAWVASTAILAINWPPSPFPYGGAAFSTYIRALITYADTNVYFNGDDTFWQGQQSDLATLVIDPSPPGQTNFILAQGDDPWAKSVEIAKVVGCSLYFDRNGYCTFVRDPAFSYTTPATTPPAVWNFTEGTTAIFNEAARVLDTEKTYNQIVVIGEGSGLNPQPISNTATPAQDTDPASPTYINGPFGARTKIVTNNYIYSLGQCNDYAQLLLRTSIGAHRSVTFSGIVHPALDVDDLVTITRARIGLNADSYVIDGLTIPLRADGPMTARLREIRQFTS